MYLPLTIRLVAIALLCVFHSQSYASDEFATDTRSLALGNIKALSKELSNPAYLSFQAKPQIGMYVHNHFQIKELNTVNIVGLIPNKYIDAGVRLSRFGYMDYQILSTQLSFSKKLNRKFSLGATALYTHRLDDNYTPDFNWSMAVHIGLCMQVSNAINLAFLVENMARSNIQNQSSIFHLGMNYHLSESLSFVTEASSDFKEINNLTIGFEYELMDRFFARMGIRTQPVSPSFGIAYTIKEITVDVGFSIHQTLRNNSSIGISYLF